MKKNLIEKLIILFIMILAIQFISSYSNLSLAMDANYQQFIKIDLTDNATYQHYKTLLGQIVSDVANIQKKLSSCNWPAKFPNELAAKQQELYDMVFEFNKSFKSDAKILKNMLNKANTYKNTNHADYKKLRNDFLNIYRTYDELCIKIKDTFKPLKNYATMTK